MSFCQHCNKEFVAHKQSLGLYCSNQCQKDFEYEYYIKSWFYGLEKGWTGKTKQLSNHVRRWIRETQGTACQVCGWDEKHPIDGSVLTEIDHIDGNVENTRPTNLRILCPNCHSMTPTFRARNKGSKRLRN